MSNLIESLGKAKKFASEIEVKQISVNDISPDKHQVRVNFDEEKLKELADSIREKGIQNPIHVRVNGESYIILTGERRYRAAVIAGKQEVPCIVHTEEMSEIDIKALQLIENLQRENLSALETARGFDALKSSGLGQREIARHLGISEATVSKGITILKKLPDDWIKSIESHCSSLSLEEVYNIAKESNKKKRAALYKKIMEAAGQEVPVEPEKEESKTLPKEDAKLEFTEEQMDMVWETLKRIVKNKGKMALCQYLTPKKIQGILEATEEHSDVT